MRKLYLLASYLLMPLLLLHLAMRGLRDRDWLKRWSERFAFYRQAIPPGGIIVHAASVGEVNAAASLIRALRTRYPELPLTVTCFTPSGSARIRSLFPAEVHHVYLPLDLWGAVRRFLKHTRPRLLIVMETELWPNLFLAAQHKKVPLLLANARISDRSFRGYRRLKSLVKRVLTSVSYIAAQSEADALRFAELGASKDRIDVTGNLKFDLDLPPDVREKGHSLRQSWGVQRPVIVAGSTHEADETPLIQAFREVKKAWPETLLVLVPRHPERFQSAAALARSAGLGVALRSEGMQIPAGIDCLVVDAMGELLSCYAACDIAFVGGSLAPVGGHNLLEPAAISAPVLIGPHTQHSAEITAQLIDAGAAWVVHDAKELGQALLRLLGDAALRHQMGDAGQRVFSNGQGALDRTFRLVWELLESQGISD